MNDVPIMFILHVWKIVLDGDIRHPSSLTLDYNAVAVGAACLMLETGLIEC